MTRNLNEDSLTEQPVIHWLKEMGYDYEFGPDLAPGQILGEREDFREVVLAGRLKRSVRRLNPDLPEAEIDDVVRAIIKFEHPNLEIANKEVYKMITQGVKVGIRDKSGEEKGWLVKVFDFKNPQNNEFLVVNQFAVQGIEKVRRPDVIVFVNGIPLVIFELKNPTLENATVHSAFEQLQEYKKDIPDIFKYNQILVVSDLMEAKHGTISSPWEWFSVWKGVKSENENHKLGESLLEILVKGIFHKTRFLDIVENFIIFEADPPSPGLRRAGSETGSSAITKKMAMYHQYFGVNKAVNETLRAAKPRGNKKIGVFWHTQGSGKSLSMVFYANKAKRLEELKSPTFVFLTDRNDLDGQFYKTFLRSGYPTAQQAESIANLQERLRSAGAELIFTTIQKFDTEYEKLSDRENIIVIADEAHRSQYAKFAANVRAALPNASFMGITGTPISLQNRETRLVFGEHISEYKINQAVIDGATVPIYYEGRLVPLHLANQFIDEEFDQLTDELEFEEREAYRQRWARLEQAVSAKDRLEQVAKDIVEHFNNRGLEGKGMIVTISRKTAVLMYKIISKIPNAPEVAVVISKTEDFRGQIQSELDNKELEKRFKNPEDSLRLVIVCDMWLTGFDVPPLHTMYIDKPLKNHTLMQAIARVNRIFKDKPGGLIVDYIGVADDLKKALSIYSSGIQKEAMIPIEEIVSKMMEKYDIVRAMFSGVEYLPARGAQAGKTWKNLKGAELAGVFQKAVNIIITDEKSGKLDDEKKKRFAKETEILSQLFAFVMPHREANEIRNEVEFFQAVKRAIIKRTIIRTESIGLDIESAVRELVSKAISAEGVIDIFDMKGKARPDISIFDERFLEEVKNMKYKNLSIDVLRKLLHDELRTRMKTNLVRYKSLLDMLEDIIEKYENNIINSTKVIEKLIELAKEIKKVAKLSEGMGLSEEEMAFYDAISVGRKFINGNGELKELVRELVRTIKRDLSIDWMNNDIIKARIRANVKLLLLQKGFKIKESEIVLDLIYQQVFSLYKDFVSVTI